jgi:hypothetical protein
LNFGILFAWVAVNSVLFPFCCYFMRHMTAKGAKKEKKEQEEQEKIRI